MTHSVALRHFAEKQQDDEGQAGVTLREAFQQVPEVFREIVETTIDEILKLTHTSLKDLAYLYALSDSSRAISPVGRLRMRTKGRRRACIAKVRWRAQSIPEIVAVVQAKKYSDRPIGREPVAALSALAAMERAPKAIFVTTSRYQPAAREFAFLTQGRLDLPSLELADLGRLEEWCRHIASTLEAYFQKGGQAPPIIANQSHTELTGKIVLASGGYDMTINSFAMVEADFPHEVVLRPIGSRKVSGDGQVGTEVPDAAAPAGRSEAERFVAFKKRWEGSGEVGFWGQQRLYSLWKGEPVHFNCD